MSIQKPSPLTVEPETSEHPLTQQKTTPPLTSELVKAFDELMRIPSPTLSEAGRGKKSKQPNRKKTVIPGELDSGKLTEMTGQTDTGNTGELSLKQAGPTVQKRQNRQQGEADQRSKPPDLLPETVNLSKLVPGSSAPIPIAGLTAEKDPLQSNTTRTDHKQPQQEEHLKPGEHKATHPVYKNPETGNKKPLTPITQTPITQTPITQTPIAKERHLANGATGSPFPLSAPVKKQRAGQEQANPSLRPLLELTVEEHLGLEKPTTRSDHPTPGNIISGDQLLQAMHSPRASSINTAASPIERMEQIHRLVETIRVSLPVKADYGQVQLQMKEGVWNGTRIEVNLNGSQLQVNIQPTPENAAFISQHKDSLIQQMNKACPELNTTVVLSSSEDSLPDGRSRQHYYSQSDEDE